MPAVRRLFVLYLQLVVMMSEMTIQSILTQPIQDAPAAVAVAARLAVRMSPTG